MPTGVPAWANRTLFHNPPRLASSILLPSLRAHFKDQGRDPILFALMASLKDHTDRVHELEARFSQLKESL
jgi:hypothetical protein